EVSVRNLGEGRRVRDSSYAGYRGERVTAYLVEPTNEGPNAGVLFLHRGSGDRSVFLAEALVLARAGAVSLLIDAPQARPAPWRKPFDVAEPDSLRELFVQTVVDLRRGIDLLCARPDLDRGRIGFVGQRFGANAGALLLASDPRVKVADLMCLDPSWTATLRSSRSPGATGLRRALPADRFKHLIETMEPLDAAVYLGRTHAKLLLQYARYDNELAGAAGGRLVGSASVRWYEAGRELNDLEALEDRVTWIEEGLELRPVPASRSARQRAGPEPPPAANTATQDQGFGPLDAALRSRRLDQRPQPRDPERGRPAPRHRPPLLATPRGQDPPRIRRPQLRRGARRRPGRGGSTHPRVCSDGRRGNAGRRPARHDARGVACVRGRTLG